MEVTWYKQLRNRGKTWYSEVPDMIIAVISGFGER